MRRQRRTAGAALLGSCGALLFLAAGCKSYEPRDYVAACTDGKPVKLAAPYDPAGEPGSEYPVFVAEKRADLKHWIWGDTPDLLHAAGIVQPYRQNHERTQLLLCIEQEERAFGRDCDMSGKIVKMYDAQYRITLREARTARVIATRDALARVRGQCPQVVAVSMTEKEPKRYARLPEKDIAELITPHLPSKVRARLAEAAEQPE